MAYTTTVIIGAGQAGLAMSFELSARGIDHVILERGQIANAWIKDRWDSLHLLTPNWQSRLPGGAYTGPDPDGFASKAEVSARLQGYAQQYDMPVRTGVDVQSVTSGPNGYRVHTQVGPFDCRHVVVASGACARPAIPQATLGSLLQHRSTEIRGDHPRLRDGPLDHLGEVSAPCRHIENHGRIRFRHDPGDLPAPEHVDPEAEKVIREDVALRDRRKGSMHELGILILRGFRHCL